MAEGDAVFARFDPLVTLPEGSTTSLRTIAYDLIVDGTIAVKDMLSEPNTRELFGSLPAPPSD